MAALSLSVAICTWNRAPVLAQTLERLAQAAVPADVTWDVVVVNNRSTDGTDEVIASFAGHLPVTRVWEATPGTAHARNAALAAARGDYVLWIDDDILVGRAWIEAYVRAFRRWPDAAIFGGPIDPHFEGEAPAWLLATLDRIGPAFGRQTFGTAPIALTAALAGNGPYGGNMAMRREAQLRFPFNTALGSRHAAYSPGEETDVIRRMLAAGLSGWWTPEPAVGHWIPAAAQTEAYLRRWMEGCGRYEARTSPLEGSRLALDSGWQAVRAAGHETSFRLLRHVAPPRIWVSSLACAALARGRLLERRAARQASRAPA